MKFKIVKFASATDSATLLFRTYNNRSTSLAVAKHAAFGSFVTNEAFGPCVIIFHCATFGQIEKPDKDHSEGTMLLSDDQSSADSTILATNPGSNVLYNISIQLQVTWRALISSGLFSDRFGWCKIQLCFLPRHSTIAPSSSLSLCVSWIRKPSQDRTSKALVERSYTRFHLLCSNTRSDRTLRMAVSSHTDQSDMFLSAS